MLVWPTESAIIPFLKVMYLILNAQVPLTTSFCETDSVFLTPVSNKYSTIHALGLVPASTIPRDGTSWYKP